jgi:hypothetical protein
MTQEEIIAELKKLTKQRTIIAKQQALLKQQLAPYAKYNIGDQVKIYFYDEYWTVRRVMISAAGKFSYDLQRMLANGDMELSRTFAENTLSPI